MLPLNVLIGAGLGLVVGAFLPSVGRKIKSMWVKETQAGKKAVLVDVAKVEGEVQKVEHKL